MIKVEHLRKSYTQGDNAIHVLKDVSFDVNKGESIAILGKSGSGKSTFLSLIAGLDQADAGTINIDQLDLVKLNEEQLTEYRAKKLGIIFQQFHLMDHLTALENVKLALDIAKISNSQKVAKEFLDEVGLSGRYDHLPSQLSGGEKQRVAMARAICVRPDLLLADEPSGNLDEDTADFVMNLLFSLVKKHQQTLILVTHDNELATRCDKIYRLEEGILKLQ